LEVYADPSGTEIQSDVRAVLLETTSTGGEQKTERAFPTTREKYQPGQVLTWEWVPHVWGESWFRHPDRDIRNGWTSSLEFVGRSIAEI
jgi:hypothetical protein